MKPGKLQRNKQRSQGLSWKVNNSSLSFVLCSNTLAELCNRTFLLVSSSSTNHDLLHGHGQKSEQKHRTKNFAKFHNHLPLLTIDR